MLKAMRRGRGAPHDREQGAALVEFALLFPVFMTLILGMFTGGLAYNQNISLTHAAREGARYAATLAKEPGGLPATNWTGAVIDRVVEAATDDLDTTQPGHFVCVALVKADGTTVWTDTSGTSYSKIRGTPPTALPSHCYGDGLTDPYSRVHVVVGRPGKIQTIAFTRNLQLNSKGTARYEAGA